MRTQKIAETKITALYITISSLFISGCSGLMTQQTTLDKWHPNSSVHSSLSTSDLKRAAESGSTEAKFDLAVRLMEGDRVAKDQVQAVKTIEEVAKGGDPRAQYLLGSAYICHLYTSPSPRAKRHSPLAA